MSHLTVENGLTGALPKRSKPQLIAALLSMQLRESVEQTVRFIGVNRPKTLRESELAVPDSAICRQATELAETVMDRHVLAHCLRSYKFGAAIARHAALKFDAEVFYLAALLHDLGLTPAYDGSGDFELNGAKAARDFLLEKQYATERADRVHEAIALHTSVGIAHHGDPEMRLVHFGAGVDILGIQRQNIGIETMAHIMREYPRTGFVDHFTALLEREAQSKPSCHIAASLDLGFIGKMRANPVNKVAC